MVVSTNKAEARLKAAVIDRLLATNAVDDDAVLISEMTVANWSRRADVVLANGKLWAFEIKSELDSLTRLTGQVETFRRHFEKVTIVSAARFEKQIRDRLPDGVGLWVEEADGSLVQRLAPRHTALSREAAISLMTVVELRRVLQNHGVSTAGKLARSGLIHLASELPARSLTLAARTAVKRRYRDRHARFMQERNVSGSLGAMHKLRRTPVHQSAAATPRRLMPEEVQIPLGHPLLVHSPSGPVLKRRLV